MVYYRVRPVSLKDAAYRVMRQAYMAASANGTLPANPRQIMYAARPETLKIAEKDTLDSQYFCQTLLPDYINDHSDECATWDIAWDDRRHFGEPHTGRRIGLGTLAVRQYVSGYANPLFEEAGFARATIETHGPEGRYGGLLYLEKEGFTPILERARLAEKFDVSIMSCKGMSVTAARSLIDKTCARYGIPLLILHDFDVSGFSIAKTLVADTRRFSFKSTFKTVDLGLRLTDVRELGLESEPVSFGNVSPSKIRERLKTNGATADEIAFLLEGQRVELNAMTSDQFVAFVERKLTEAGIPKIVPPKDQLDKAYRLFARSERIRTIVKEAIAADADAEIAVPDDLVAQVRAYLAEHPDEPWEDAVTALQRAEVPARSSLDDEHASTRRGVPMTARERLPNRRQCESLEFSHGGLVFTLCAGSSYPDGRIAEIFISSLKPGSPIEAIARDAAVTVSIALQFGADLETIKQALTKDHDGSPATLFGAALDKLAERAR
jgi:hypothetical protein